VFSIFDLAFPKIVDPTIFIRDLFLFGALRARFFLYAGISVARRRQSTKSQVTAVSVNRGLPVRQSTKSQFARVPSRASSPRSRRSQSSRRARPLGPSRPSPHHSAPSLRGHRPVHVAACSRPVRSAPTCCVKKGGCGAGERRVRAGRRSHRGKLLRRVGRSRTTRSPGNLGY